MADRINQLSEGPRVAHDTPAPQLVVSIVDGVDTAKVRNWMQFIQKEISIQRPKTLVILLSSQGGAVNDAIVFHNFLRALPCRVIIHCIGNIESAANLILVAAAHRTAAPGVQFTFHGLQVAPSTGLVSINRLAQLVEVLRESERTMARLLVERSHLKIEEASAIVSGHISISSEEALRLGLIHEVSGFIIPEGAHHHIL